MIRPLNLPQLCHNSKIYSSMTAPRHIDLKMFPKNCNCLVRNDKNDAKKCVLPVFPCLMDIATKNCTLTIWNKFASCLRNLRSINVDSNAKHSKYMDTSMGGKLTYCKRSNFNNGANIVSTTWFFIKFTSNFFASTFNSLNNGAN